VRKKNNSLGNHKFAGKQAAFIIAEAGVNHNGSLKIAKRLIDAAKDSGADAVKFQTFKAEELATEYAPKADYQKHNGSGNTQYEMLKQLELSEEQFRKLYNYCKKSNILFLSTPFDTKSADFLFRLGMSIFKISSGDLTNLPLLIHIAGYGRPIILSTGMSTIKEIRDAVKVIFSAGNRRLTLLHCTSNYPTKYEDVNLRAMDSMKKFFHVPIGYSDHTQGSEIALAAVVLGAAVIEKHFTLDNNLTGPDHKTSLEPKEFREMVGSIRIVESALGDGVKKPAKSESDIRLVARKSIVADRDISRGTKITRDMLAIKRPGTGIAPKWLSRLVGKHVKRTIKRDRVFNWDLIV